MNLSTFEDHLDRHGSDLARWPADSRAEAAALLDTTPRARTLLHAMQDVDAYLRVKRPPSTEAAGHIAATAMRQRQALPHHRLSRNAAWSAAAGVALFLGCCLGGIAPQQHDDTPDVVLATSLDASGATDVD